MTNPADSPHPIEEPSSDWTAEDRSRLHSGLKWVGASLVLSRTLVYGSHIVLAWLLAREAIGLVGWAIGVTMILSAFREIGFGQAYIHRRDATVDEARLAADTVFWITATMNTMLFLAAFLAAPTIAAWFPKMGSAETVAPILRILLAGFLIDALSSTPSFVLQKRMQFARHSVGELAGGVVNASIAITLALNGLGIWSLVIAHLVARGVTAIVYSWLAEWRPRLRFDRRIARELFVYGRSLWAFSALSAVGGQLDRQVIGKLFGAAPVGVYNMAYGICRLPPTQIASLVNRVAFPALSKLAADTAAMRRGFLKALSHVAVLAIPMGMGMHAVAEDFVLVVYGAKWIDTVPLIRVLVAYGVILAVSSVAGPVLMAIGKPQTLLYTSIVHHALLVAAMFALSGFGALGIAWAIVIPMTSSALIAMALVVRFLQLAPGRVLSPLVRVTAAALVMHVVVAMLRGELIEWLPRWACLATSVAVGGVVYVAALSVVTREVFREFRSTVRSVLSRKRFA